MDDIELTADEDLTGSRLILHHRIHFHGSLTGRDITGIGSRNGTTGLFFRKDRIVGYILRYGREVGSLGV